MLLYYNHAISNTIINHNSLLLSLTDTVSSLIRTLPLYHTPAAVWIPGIWTWYMYLMACDIVAVFGNILKWVHCLLHTSRWLFGRHWSDISHIYYFHHSMACCHCFIIQVRFHKQLYSCLYWKQHEHEEFRPETYQEMDQNSCIVGHAHVSSDDVMGAS